MRKTDENKLLIRGARESLRALMKNDTFAAGVVADLNKRGITGDARYVVLCDALLRYRDMARNARLEKIRAPWWKRWFRPRGGAANA